MAQARLAQADQRDDDDADHGRTDYDDDAALSECSTASSGSQRLGGASSGKLAGGLSAGGLLMCLRRVARGDLQV